MIYEIISMNGYGVYVWSAFAFTLISFSLNCLNIIELRDCVIFLSPEYFFLVL